MEIQLFEAMTVDIPDEFKAAGADECKTYFGAAQPNYAFIAEKSGAAIGIVRTNTPLTDEMVENQIAAYQQYYSRMVPGFVMGEMRKNNQVGRNVAFMSYKSNAPTKDLYNILGITTLGDKELVFLFSCEMQDALQFTYIFIKVLDSMTFSE